MINYNLSPSTDKLSLQQAYGSGYTQTDFWTVHDVKVWLGIIGHECLHHRFLAHSVDGTCLCELTEADLRQELSIKSKFTIEKLVTWINYGFKQFNERLKSQEGQNRYPGGQSVKEDSVCMADSQRLGVLSLMRKQSNEKFETCRKRIGAPTIHSLVQQTIVDPHLTNSQKRLLIREKCNSSEKFYFVDEFPFYLSYRKMKLEQKDWCQGSNELNVSELEADNSKSVTLQRTGVEPNGRSKVWIINQDISQDVFIKIQKPVKLVKHMQLLIGTHQASIEIREAIGSENKANVSGIPSKLMQLSPLYPAFQQQANKKIILLHLSQQSINNVLEATEDQLPVGICQSRRGSSLQIKEPHRCDNVFAFIIKANGNFWIANPEYVQRHNKSSANCDSEDSLQYHSLHHGYVPAMTKSWSPQKPPNALWVVLKRSIPYLIREGTLVRIGQTDFLCSFQKNEEPVIHDSNLCIVCAERVRNCIFTGCNHNLACLQCSKNLSSCPACRKKIEDIERLYFE